MVNAGDRVAGSTAPVCGGRRTAGVALVAVILSGACGGFVGIHPYRDGAAVDEGSPSSSGGAGAHRTTGDAGANNGQTGGQSGGGPGADGGPVAAQVGSAPPVLDADSSGGAQTGGQVSGDGATGAITPPVDAAGAGAGSVSDPSVDGGTDGEGGAGGGDGAVCPALPVMAGTVFLFSAGPNSASMGMGMCSFPNGSLATAGHWYGAVNLKLYASAAACGVCVKATYGGQSVELTIVDASDSSTLTMDPGALKALSGSTQNIQVQFSFVPCSDPGTIRVLFTSNSDASAVIVGHRNQLKSVRMAPAGGTSVELTRTSYNVWRPPVTNGFGATVTLTLTDIYQNTIELTGLAVKHETFDTGMQLPAPICPM